MTAQDELYSKMAHLSSKKQEGSQQPNQHDLVIRCYGTEEGYGFQVMMDQLLESGLNWPSAKKIASTWFKQPRCDKGAI